ncbi:IS66 family transposase [Chitinophaga filiformis]|nr:IS66 family transposase [Chitinophaga filiformis]MCF6403169.1 IS66 family transposase [Chitinophaga filiformis]
MDTVPQKDYKQLYEQVHKENQELKAELHKMQLQMNKFQQMLFGSKRDRFIDNPAQLLLELNTTEAYPSSSLNDVKKVTYVKTDKKSRAEQSSLHAYLEKLPRVYETGEPNHLPLGAEKIGEEQHEVLEYTPGKLFVRVIITPRYKININADKDQTIILSAPAPEQPLFKCIAGSTMLAHLITAKICDHMPLYRLSKAFERIGSGLPYNTLLDWYGAAADMITPLYGSLRKEALAFPYIHVDETTLKVICAEENRSRQKIHDGYMWCYNNSIKKLVFFDYQPGRRQNCTIGILKDFKGVIQTDGWQVYEKNAAKQKDITQICCLVHARRKFTDAQVYDKELAGYALTRFNELYAIERVCKEQQLDYDQIRKIRQKESVPILDDLHKWMQQQYQTLPSAPITAALKYSLERWDNLSLTIIRWREIYVLSHWDEKTSYLQAVKKVLIAWPCYIASLVPVL